MGSVHHLGLPQRDSYLLCKFYDFVHRARGGGQRHSSSQMLSQRSQGRQNIFILVSVLIKTKDPDSGPRVAGSVST